MAEEPINRTKFRQGLKSLLDESQADAEQFKAYLEESQESIDSSVETAETSAGKASNVEKLVTAAAQRVSELTSTVDSKYSAFLDLVSGINNKRTGVNAKLKRLSDAQTKSEKLEKETRDMRNEASLARDEAQEKLKEIATGSEQMSSLLADSEGIRAQIEKTYKLATNVGLAGALFKRKSELNIPVYIWLGSFVLFGLATVGATIWILAELNSEPIPTVLSRALFVTPLLALSIFSFTQYRHERRLLEMYAFRAAMAQSLESYTEILSRDFSEAQYKDRVVDFVIDSMAGIYDQKSLDAPKFQFQMGAKSQFASLEATLKEEASGINRNIDEVDDKVNNVLAKAE